MAKNISEIETKLWSAADSLRGNMSAEEYMHVILGILSLKYISDRYKIGITAAIAEGFSKEDLDFDDLYYTYHAFKVTEKASWDYIMKFANTPEIGNKLDEAFIELETQNKMLTGIFNKNYNQEGLDQKKLGEVVKIFSDEDFSQKEEEDIIGRIYEYFLRHFFKDRGQKGGEFYTPTSIVRLMVSVLKPMIGTIYDPCCGSGGILVQARKYIKEHHGDIKNMTAFGQEYNIVTWKLAKLNLVLNGFPLEDTDHNPVLGETSGDTFANDLHKNRKFDFVMANPPFNIKKWGQEGLLDDPRWKWGVPPSGNANYAWLSHIISKLNSDGRAAVILANGSLSSSQKDELQIRKNLIAANKIDAIVELPDKLFYTTGIPACIWFFNNNKKTNQILMISGSAIEGRMISKKLRELQKSDIDKIVSLFDQHENGKTVAELGFAKSITKAELEENDYSFVPGRYVGTKEEKIDKEQVKKEIKELSSEISNLLKEFNELAPKVEEAIQKALDFKDEEA
ncbi:type I restriction-modification system subunit M [Spiroplasma attinicola]|uniref:type I restriction-modification system subunit M n=1 Tax=Spiroplasma attinicola TaxID=2904537 RepID=UPI0020229E7D|nr:class I SAM-dependent DNA methyltransferase [Spiroplasma sp. JKS002670]MCL8209779.1 putative type I restriction enzymeP M protein [Spiroplasma sp. JKS002670]